MVRLNRIIPLAKINGAAAALVEMEQLVSDASLRDYHYLDAVTADLLVEAGDTTRAAHHYRRAIGLAANDVERSFLQRQLDRLGDRSSVRAWDQSVEGSDNGA